MNLKENYYRVKGLQNQTMTKIKSERDKEKDTQRERVGLKEKKTEKIQKQFSESKRELLSG